MSNISSNQIRVFPTSQREGIDPAAKFTTEYNLTSIINKLLDTKAFVIDNTLSIDRNILTKLEFNIMGYYFFIENVDLQSIEGTGSYLNASITVNYNQYTGDRDSSTLFNWASLQGVDDEDDLFYSGVTLKWEADPSYVSKNNNNNNKENITSEAVSSPQGGNDITYTFTILRRSGNTNDATYSIPDECKIRFKTDDIHHSLCIDDGVI